MLPGTLTYLECVASQLTSINIPKSVSLANLQWNKFDVLDLRKNILTRIKCSANVIFLPKKFYLYDTDNEGDNPEIVFRGKVYSYVSTKDPNPWLDKINYENDHVLK